MFVLTFKWTKRNAVLILLAVAALLSAVIIFAGVRGRSAIQRGKNIRTNEDRLAYLASMGWECESEALREQNVVIPQEFSGVFEEYNRLQKQQGFDLSRYAGLEAGLYQYKVLGYPSAGRSTVIAQLLILNYEVIGGDIHSTDFDGFMHGLR